MKIRTEKISQIKQYYTCEFCQKEYDYLSDATLCELDCREKICNHSEYLYEISSYVDYNTDILKKCKECHKVLESKCLKNSTPDQIKQVWEML